MPVIGVESLRLSYGAREALAGIDLQIEAGEIFGLLGPNGGGKSTLFRILATLLAPTSGTANICGLDVGTSPHGVRRRISVVFQSPSLDKKLTVEENLRHHGHLYGMGGQGLETEMSRNLERLGLEDRGRDTVETLSGGLKRRVEIAKALLHHPEVLLLDEPTTGLDPGARKEVWDHLLDLQAREGMTILVTTHLMDEAERCHRIAILHRGRICALGTPAELRASIGGEVVVIQASDLEAVEREIREAFSVEPSVVDGGLRIEQSDGPRFVAEVMERLGERVQGISVGRPTLEDVFVSRTGETFATAEAAALE